MSYKYCILLFLFVFLTAAGLFEEEPRSGPKRREMDPCLALEVSALARMRDIFEVEARGDSIIQQSYRGATVFVTGASGFLGKQFVEKLLRSTDVDKVYLLVRTKKGKNAKERLKDALADPLFDRVRKLKPSFSTKLVAVEGDMTELALGMSKVDRELVTKEVNFIFHGAATIRFDENLVTATITNVRGTREVLDLAKSCRNLRAFVHVSTAYSHATKSRRNKSVLEQFYNMPVQPQVLIEIAENKDVQGLEEMTALLTQEWPNTYTFTKAVAEELVRSQSDSIPICIVRPSIILSAYREPTPGWVDTSATFGPAGVIIGVGLGLIHTMFADRDVKIDVVTSDLVNNAIMAAGWATANKTSTEITIYTVSSNRNSTTWGALGDCHRTESRNISTPKAVWYCYSFDASNKLVFTLLFWLLHYIPAYIIDGMCFLTGKPRQFVKLYTKAYKLFVSYSYFTTNSWQFSDNNLRLLYKKMSESDRKIYNFDASCIEWKEFMLIWGMGLRKYIIKDGLTGTDYAVKKQFWLCIANAIVLVLYAYLWLKLFTFMYSCIQCIF